MPRRNVLSSSLKTMAVVAASWCLVACGGSGGDDFTEGAASIGSTAALDGFVRSDTVFSSTSEPSTGDATGGISTVQVFSFDLSSIPADATITSAVLRLRQASVFRTPYVDLGDVVVDHFDIGQALDATDFDGGTIAAAFGTLSTDTTLEVKSLDVAARVQADLSAGRTRSSFRIRHTLPNDTDGDPDVSQWEDAENNFATGDVPILDVAWRTP